MYYNKMNFLLIDTSYVIFYRYYAIQRWYQFAHKDDKFEKDYDWSNNEIFLNKFKDKFLDTISKIIKKYNIKDEYIIFCRDCPRKNIWRNIYYNQYKLNRNNEDNDNIGKFFKIAYNEIIPELIKEKKFKLLNHDKLEADDIIYLTKKHIQEKLEYNKIIIIANDYDLLQILDNNTILINLKEKLLNEKSDGSPEIDLSLKIICGDKSDNIPSCFKNCGKKTGLKLIENKNLLLNKFKENPESLNIYAINKMIIDLSNIPIELKDSFEIVLNNLFETFT